MSSPYVKVSSDLPLQTLTSGNSAYPALVMLWFMTALARQQSHDGRVRVSDGYGEIMLATGIARQRTIVTTLTHLADAGLITYCGQAADGYRYYEVCSAYVICGPGAPSGDGDNTDRSGLRTVVSSSSESSYSYSEDTDSTTTTNDSARSATPQTAVDDRLKRLGLAVSDDTWRGLVAEHGTEAVVKYARWYAHAHREGLANGPGWLYAACKQRWDSPPLGFDASEWKTAKERYAGGRYAEEIEV